MRIGEFIEGIIVSGIVGLITVLPIILIIYLVVDPIIKIICNDFSFIEDKVTRIYHSVIFVLWLISSIFMNKIKPSMIIPKDVDLVNEISVIESNKFRVDNIEYSILDVLLQPEGSDIPDLIVKGQRYKNKGLYGIGKELEEYSVLLISRDTLTKIKLKDNVHIVEVKQDLLDTITELYYNKYENGSVKIINNTIKVSDTTDNDKIIAENKELEQKVSELQLEIDELKNKSKHTKLNININKYDILIILLGIWLLGLSTYVIITKHKANIKKELLITSSDLKIREGVMLEHKE